MKRLVVLLIIALFMTGCATSQLTKDSTFAEKSAAICSDLDAAVLLSQIGLSYAQQSNYGYDYSKAQMTLVEANSAIKTTCAAVQTEDDLLKVRNVVLQALAKAAQQQAEVKMWK